MAQPKKEVDRNQGFGNEFSETSPFGVDDSGNQASPTFQNRDDLSDKSATLMDKSGVDTSVQHPRYQILQQIGEGGMGVVLHARDRFLQRDVAIKVLSADRSHSQGFVDKFIEEAQIASQLQHPSIVPIHDIGKLDDGRPFFAMKLVKGQTLERLLDARSSLSENQQRLIVVFGQVCQAIAVAHSKSVIHRDLKPANIMVGRYDEVQVMDWGLAKILPLQKTTAAHSENTIANGSTSEIIRSEEPSAFARTDEVPQPVSTSSISGIDEVSLRTKDLDINDTDKSDSANSWTLDQTVIQSIRFSAKDPSLQSKFENLSQSSETSSLTSQGSIMGTLSYMPPEQAEGKNNELDFRSDVFSLGGILARILTGEPPYIGESKPEKLLKVMQADLNACWQRLDASPFDRELVALCRWCLSKEPDQRPKDASVVAERISQYRIEIADRLRQAEMDRAAADVRLESTIRTNVIEQKKRQWAWGATVAASLLILLAVGSAAWIAKQQSSLSLAQSNEKIAVLERASEQSARLEQSRLELQQSLSPIRATLQQFKSMESLPANAGWVRLSQQLQAADDIQGRVPVELLAESDLPSLTQQYSEYRNWSAMLNGSPNELSQECLRLLGATQETSPQVIADQLKRLPRWARELARAELMKSIHRRGSMPAHWSPAIVDSDWESDMWSAIAARDIDRMVDLSKSESIVNQPLATQLALAESLIDQGPSAVTAAAIQDSKWTLVEDITVAEFDRHKLRITEDGWIVMGNPIRFNTEVPREQIVAIRLETYFGPPFLDTVKWRSKPVDQAAGKTPIDEIRVKTAPSITSETLDTRFGPGLRGIGPENCCIRELSMERVSSQGERWKFRMDRYLTGHTTIAGREANRAIDGDSVSQWALGHPQGETYCSTIFEARKLESWQWYPEIHFEIDTGDPELWDLTEVGPFRLYYTTELIQKTSSPTQAALKILEPLEQQFPGYAMVLALISKARLETGEVSKVNREATVALAATAASMDPESGPGLRFLTESVLAMEPKGDDPWYKRLIAQIERCQNSSLAEESRLLVARYQRERGDRAHKLLPAVAYEAYTEAQKLDPKGFHRHGRLAFELLRNGKVVDSMEIAKLGVSGTTIDPEDLLFYGTVALRTQNAAEAFPVFQRCYQQQPQLRELDDLAFVYARVCFREDQIGRGQEIVQQLEGKIGQSPNVITDAALAIARGKRADCVEWLLYLWARHDSESVQRSLDGAILRDRKMAWGLAAMAAIEVGEEKQLRSVLEEVATRYPEVVDDAIRVADALLLARVPPSGPCVSTANSEKLIELLGQMQPDDPRWLVRLALLHWLEGRSDSAWSLLKSLPTDLDDDGEKIFRSSPVRRWDAMARVVVATMRLVEANQNSAFEKWKETEHAQFEVDAAQKCLGRVPEGDRDLADWLWWEYRLKPRP